MLFPAAKKPPRNLKRDLGEKRDVSGTEETSGVTEPKKCKMEVLTEQKPEQEVKVLSLSQGIEFKSWY